MIPNKKLRLIHLITDLEIGGAEMMLYKLVSGMDRNRFENVIVSMTTEGPVANKIKLLDIPVYALGMRNGMPNPVYLAKLMRIIKREKPHILQTWMYHADLMGLLAGTLSGVKHIAWNIRCSNMDISNYRRLSGWTRKVCAILSKMPEAVVINSKNSINVHKKYGYHPRSWKVIPNGFDLAEFKPDEKAYEEVRIESGLSKDTVIIGNVSRFDPMKGHEVFFEAAGLLSERYKNIVFMAIGTNVTEDNPSIKQLIEKNNVKKVFALGSRSDMPRLMAAMDIFTLSSIYGEGFPNVIGEAMSCGVPCVVTNVGDCAEIVGETGYVIPPGDSMALLKAWQKLITMGQEYRRKIGESAKSRMEKFYSLGTIVRKYEDFYNKLYSGNL